MKKWKKNIATGFLVAFFTAGSGILEQVVTAADRDGGDSAVAMRGGGGGSSGSRGGGGGSVGASRGGGGSVGVSRGGGGSAGVSRGGGGSVGASRGGGSAGAVRGGGGNTSRSFSQPATSRRAEPARTQTAQPTRTQTSQPTRVQPAQPTRTQTAQPTRVQPTRPTRTQTTQPTRVQPAQPTRSMVAKPPISDSGRSDNRAAVNTGGGRSDNRAAVNTGGGRSDNRAAVNTGGRSILQDGTGQTTRPAPNTNARGNVQSPGQTRSDGGNINRPNTGGRTRPDGGAVTRPDTGGRTRPDGGAVTRPDTGGRTRPDGGGQGSPGHMRPDGDRGSRGPDKTPGYVHRDRPGGGDHHVNRPPDYHRPPGMRPPHPGGHPRPMPPRPHWYYHMRPDYYPFYYNPWYYRPGWLPVYDAIIYPWWIVGGVRTGTCVYVYNTNTYIPSDSYYLEPTAGTGQAQLPPPPDPVDNSAPNITKEQIQDAWKKIQAADTTFAEGKYEDAMKQYQAVADAIPQMPDPWVRMTIAALAEDDFEWAVQASLHGMTLATGWPCSPFSLDYMYQQNREKKADDLKMLNAVVGANAQNSDIMFLAGMIYYFDGQKDEATRHLNLAKQMEPDLNDFVEPMIKNLDEAKAKQPAAN